MPDERPAGEPDNARPSSLTVNSLLRLRRGVPETARNALRGWSLFTYAMVPVILMGASLAHYLTRPGGGTLASMAERPLELAITFLLLVLIPLDVGGAVRRGVLARFPHRGQVAFVAGFVLTGAAFVLSSSWPLLFLVLVALAAAARRSSAYASVRAEMDRYTLLIASSEGTERRVFEKLRQGQVFRWRDAEKKDAFNAVFQFSVMCALVFGVSLAWADISEKFERSGAAPRGQTEIAYAR